MKSVTRGRTTKATPKYPYLGINLIKTKIVLFDGPSKGTAVWTKQAPSLNLGEYSDEWDEDIFTPYNGTVTLSND